MTESNNEEIDILSTLSEASQRLTELGEYALGEKLGLVNEVLSRSTIILNHPFITTAEAADVLGVPLSKVRGWFKGGVLNGYVHGRTELISPRSVKKLIDEAPAYRAREAEFNRRYPVFLTIPESSEELDEENSSAQVEKSTKTKSLDRFPPFRQAPPGTVFVTTGEAMKLLSVKSINTVKAWAEQGYIDGYRKGQRIVVSVDSIDRWNPKEPN